MASCRGSLTRGSIIGLYLPALAGGSLPALSHREALVNSWDWGNGFTNKELGNSEVSFEDYALTSGGLEERVPACPRLRPSFQSLV